MGRYVSIAALVALLGISIWAVARFLDPRESDSLRLTPNSAIDADEARSIVARATELRTSALLVMHEGKAILEWGDTGKSHDVRSIRKSFTNLILGHLVAAEALDLEATLKELGIGDTDFALDEVESSATVRELMESRSGVYHEAARETSSAARYRPARGAYAPGEYWYYNNWDFNALEAIIAQAWSAASFCNAFRRYLEPVFERSLAVTACVERLEAARSAIPAHVLHLTARDLAKFGEVYLNGGVSAGERLVPEEWIAWSVEPVSDFHFIETSKFNYGRLFWSIDPYGPLEERSFMARGAGSQYVWIVPELDLTIVHLVRTHPLGLRQRLGLIPDDNDAWQLGGRIAAAVAGESLDVPRLY